MYNGNLMNKEKMKNNKDHKEKKTIALKQMRNVYNVFFNRNNLFNAKDSHNPKLLETIHKKADVQDYILNQSQINKNSK